MPWDPKSLLGKTSDPQEAAVCTPVLQDDEWMPLYTFHNNEDDPRLVCCVLYALRHAASLPCLGTSGPLPRSGV